MDIVIREQEAQDRAAVHEVIASAFDDSTVADLDAALAGRPSGVSLVACDDTQVVGHVRLSWGWLDAPDRLVDVLVLGPLSVAPTRQRRGVGRTLVEAAAPAAQELDAPLVFLEGNPAYYSRWGFEPATPLGFVRPSLRIPERAFQVMRLPGYEPTMTGTLVYPDTFWKFDCVGLRPERG